MWEHFNVSVLNSHELTLEWDNGNCAAKYFVKVLFFLLSVFGLGTKLCHMVWGYKLYHFNYPEEFDMFILDLYT